MSQQKLVASTQLITPVLFNDGVDSSLVLIGLGFWRQMTNTHTNLNW
jgi:hypothetical protein